MRCNYECINTIGSYKCVDVGIGADQPFSKDFTDDYDDATKDDYSKVGSDDTDGNYDIIDGASVVSECLNGFYFNETKGDCQGTTVNVLNFHFLPLNYNCVCCVPYPYF